MPFTKKYLLNFGLAFTLFYAGIAAFMNPFDWIGFVPMWVEKFGTSRELALHMHSVAEILLGVWLLSNWKVQWAGLVVALDILVILLVNGFSGGVLLITFRDVGLLFTAIYLALTND